MRQCSDVMTEQGLEALLFARSAVPGRASGSRRSQTGRLNAILTLLLKQVSRPAGIEFVDLHVAADLERPSRDVP